ncbi:putative nuclease HARBI1 [Pleurodeles waltl]|uniref:putative nuclease HARBI1 n=1 Tax=Pleurodeles waltl TaxID=8319 RepID=UPI003709BA37
MTCSSGFMEAQDKYGFLKSIFIENLEHNKNNQDYYRKGKEVQSDSLNVVRRKQKVMSGSNPSRSHLLLNGEGLTLPVEGSTPGDSAYAVRTYMMMPYLNPTTPAGRRYRSAHRTTRNVVERTFGLLKSRFRCIHKSGGALPYSPEMTCRIVATCAILHNIATSRGIPVEISDSDSDEDDDPIPPLQPADRTSPAEGRQRHADIMDNHFRCTAVSA